MAVHFLLACDAFFSLKFLSVRLENSSLEKEEKNFPYQQREGTANVSTYLSRVES